MSKMKPHNAKPRVVWVGAKGIKLFFTPTAIAKIQCYIEECNKEVGWLGKVTEYKVAEYKDSLYLCDETYLLHQDVGSATTEITPAGLVAFAEEVGLEEMGKAHLWGHSHVDMGTSPSGQDNSQMSLFKENGMEWFFRIIGNKKGEITVTYYNWTAGVVVEDVPWDVYDPLADTLREAIKAEIAEKVKDIVYTPDTYVGFNRKWDRMFDGYDDKVWDKKHQCWVSKDSDNTQTRIVTAPARPDNKAPVKITYNTPLEEETWSFKIEAASILPEWVKRRIYAGSYGDCSKYIDVKEVMEDWAISYEELAEGVCALLDDMALAEKMLVAARSKGYSVSTLIEGEGGVDDNGLQQTAQGV